MTCNDNIVEACTTRSLELLRRNLRPGGILAASVSKRADARAYTRVFGRDGALCAMAMATTDDRALQRGAIATLDALAAQQAANGQIPKYVDPHGGDADFWYLGCIDATLWWLIAVHFLKRCGLRGARARWGREVRRALAWLQCQEHKRFSLLQQNEASDWADIMPRSGFVLYTNALWYYVKRLFVLPHIAETLYHFSHLFFPFAADVADYRRARLLASYATRGAKRRDLYLSFVNFSFFGEEGDVFGNLLAVLLGLADAAMAQRIMRALVRARVADPFPARSVCAPIARNDPLWRPYMIRHRQNLESQYHNGGIWPMLGGFYVMACAAVAGKQRATGALTRLAYANSLGKWRFTEWFHGSTLAPMGMGGQSWNAAVFLLARLSLHQSVF
jgi:hypothetical protein